MGSGNKCRFVGLNQRCEQNVACLRNSTADHIAIRIQNRREIRHPSTKGMTDPAKCFERHRIAAPGSIRDVNTRDTFGGAITHSQQLFGLRASLPRQFTCLPHQSIATAVLFPATSTITAT